MSDVIFVVATILFFAICALYVYWCDKIIGPDDFRATQYDTEAAQGDYVQIVVADVAGSGSGVPA